MKKAFIALALASVMLGGFVPLVSFAENAADFVPLTSIPGVDDVENAAGLPAFLNSLYMISVGAAAVLAVLQIVRGGITYMLSDAGVTEKREAKHHIFMSIMGLVLVLSPALVFGIINPDILELNIDVSGIQPPALPQGNVTGETPCLNGQCQNGNGNDTTGSETPTTPGEVTGEGGDPATGCRPGYEVVTTSAGDICEPAVANDGSDDETATGGNVPIRICVGRTQDGTNRYVYVGSKTQRYTQSGSSAVTQCTEVMADTESTSAAACQRNISSGRTTIIGCQQYQAGAAIDGSVPAPLCAWSERYALNSSNVDCD